MIAGFGDHLQPRYLTAQYRLPQKLLVLHQFRLSMMSPQQTMARTPRPSMISYQ